MKQFSGGDRGIETAVSGLWKNEGPALASQFGTMEARTGPTMQEYMECIGKAMEAAKK